MIKPALYLGYQLLDTGFSVNNYGSLLQDLTWFLEK